MKCLNLNIPQVKSNLVELTKVFKSDKIAYGLLAQNNGYNLDKTPEGKSSKLFTDILSLNQVKGSTYKALHIKAKAYTDSFLDSFGDWLTPGHTVHGSLDNNGEPIVESILVEYDSPDFAKVQKSRTIYSKDDTIFISVDESSENFQTRLDKTKNAIKDAVKQGVTAFVTDTEFEATRNSESGKQQIRNFFLDDINFEYIEKDEAGFYVKKLTKFETIEKAEGVNVIQVNDVDINLKKLGIDFTLNEGQLETVQDFANWIDGEPVIKLPSETYNGSVVLNKGEVHATNVEAGNKLGLQQKSFGIATKTDVQNLYNLALKFPEVKVKIDVPNDMVELFADTTVIPPNIIFEKSFSELVKNRLSNKPPLNFSLIGNAGTGKTTVTTVLIEYLKLKKRSVMASAMTHKAVRVQKTFFGNKVPIETFHKAIGLRGDSKLDSLDARDVKFVKAAPAQLRAGAVFIVDEASMMNNTLYKLVLEQQDKLGFKILFIGDDKQFKPVGQTVTSKVFETDKKHISRLTVVERQESDNTLLTTLNKFREDQPNNAYPLGKTRTSSVDSKNRGIEWTTEASFNDNLEQLFKSAEFKKNPNYVRVTAYRNKTVQKYNKQIRKLLGYKEELLQGEIITAYSTLTRHGDTTLLNGGDYTVENIVPITKTLTIPGADKVIEGIKGFDVSLYDPVSGEPTTEFIVSNYNEENVFIELATAMRYLNTKLQTYGRNKQWNQYWSMKDIVSDFDSSFLTFKDLTIPGVTNSYNNKLTVFKKKSIDYGYAITAHKSQGGTYDYMLVDENDIESMYSPTDTRKNPPTIEDVNQGKYVTFSRASKGVIALTKYPITNTAAFNFGIENDFISENFKLDINQTTLDALIKDGIANKTCK